MKNSISFEHRRFAGAFLVSSNSQVFLQLRDDDREIDNPGRISVFGGSVEEGETFREGLVRELHEELGVRFADDDIDYLGPISKTESAVTTDCEFYFVSTNDFDGFEVTEGVGISFNLADALVDARLTPTVRAMLRELQFKFGYALATGSADVERLQALDALYGNDCRAFVKRVSAGRQPRTIVDFGCGHGQMAFYLAALFPDAQVYGVDASVEQLNLAKATGTTVNATNVQFVHVSELDAIAIKADLLFSKFVIIHQHDARDYLNVIRAQCARDAIAVLIEPHLSGMIAIPHQEAVYQANELTLALGREKGLNYSFDSITIAAVSDFMDISDFLVCQPILRTRQDKTTIAQSFDHISRELASRNITDEQTISEVSDSLWDFVENPLMMCAGMQIVHLAGTFRR